MQIRNRPDPYGPLPARLEVRPGVVVIGDIAEYFQNDAEYLQNELESRRCSHAFHYFTIALLAFSLAVCISRPKPM